MKKPVVVTDETIEEAYRIMARIVRNHGEKYLPVFKRLHEENEQRKAIRTLWDIALRIAQETK
jgi:hypothetical protein